MIATSEVQGGSRIALVLESTGVHPQALEMALRLADRPGRILTGLLLEDSNLLRAASFPFAEEISILGGQSRPLDVEALYRRLTRQRLRLQKTVQSQARARGIRVAFDVVRGPGLRPALDLHTQSGLTVFGCRSQRNSGAFPAPATRVIIVHDGNVSAASLETIRDSLNGSLDSSSSPWGVEEVVWSGAKALVQKARMVRPSFVVVHAPLLNSSMLEVLLESLPCPLLLVS